MVAHTNGEKLQTANRTISLHARDDTVESVHALVHPEASKMPFVPSTLSLHQKGTRSNLVRLATARAARWNGADVESLDNDIETVTNEDTGVKRHLVNSVVDSTSSPTTLLFHRNAEHPGFMNDAYNTKTRKMIGDKFIVTDADMTAAQKSLKTNLTPQTHEGLSIETVPLHGNEAEGEITVAFNINRKPLSADCYTSTEANTSKLVTVNDGLQFMGETPSDTEMLQNGDDISAKVFGVAMHDDK